MLLEWNESRTDTASCCKLFQRSKKVWLALSLHFILDLSSAIKLTTKTIHAGLPQSRITSGRHLTLKLYQCHLQKKMESINSSIVPVSRLFPWISSDTFCHLRTIFLLTEHRGNYHSANPTIRPTVTFQKSGPIELISPMLHPLFIT